MPKSKREKEVSLTKVKKKTKSSKANLLEEIRACVIGYNNLFLIRNVNLRSSFLNKVRKDFSPLSRIFFGKNHLMSVALGKTKADEIQVDLHKISNIIKGECLLMFTNEMTENVKRYFAEFSEESYARAGSIAEKTVKLPDGPLDVPGSLEPQLRSLGMPIKLENGVVHLVKKFRICKHGDVLTSEQSRILKLFNFKISVSTLELIARWSKDDGFVLL